jgi:hypothetical protein
MPFGWPVVIGWLDRIASNHRATGRPGDGATLILSGHRESVAAQEIRGGGCPRIVLRRSELVIHRAASCLEFGHRTRQ